MRSGKEVDRCGEKYPLAAALLRSSASRSIALRTRENRLMNQVEKAHLHLPLLRYDCLARDWGWGSKGQPKAAPPTVWLSRARSGKKVDGWGGNLRQTLTFLVYPTSTHDHQISQPTKPLPLYNPVNLLNLPNHRSCTQTHEPSQSAQPLSLHTLVNLLDLPNHSTYIKPPQPTQRPSLYPHPSTFSVCPTTIFTPTYINLTYNLLVAEYCFTFTVWF